MSYIESMKSIGVRELQQYTSRVIRDVEAGDEYEITVQGRPTGVVLTRILPPHRGATIDEVRRSSLYSRPDDDTRRALLEMVERRRDAAGYVGDRLEDE